MRGSQSVTRSGMGRGDVLIGGCVSLDDQIRQCRDDATRLGIDVVVDHVEKLTRSGYNERGRHRPGF